MLRLALNRKFKHRWEKYILSIILTKQPYLQNWTQKGSEQNPWSFWFGIIPGFPSLTCLGKFLEIYQNLCNPKMVYIQIYFWFIPIHYETRVIEQNFKLAGNLEHNPVFDWINSYQPADEVLTSSNSSLLMQQLISGFVLPARHIIWRQSLGHCDQTHCGCAYQRKNGVRSLWLADKTDTGFYATMRAVWICLGVLCTDNGFIPACIR